MISPRIYILVPRVIYDNGKVVTMSCGRMAAHASHAAGRLAAHKVNADLLDLIILEVPSTNDLVRAKYKLMEADLDFIEYADAARGFFGEIVTAIAVFPIEKGSNEFLNSLSSWKCESNQVEGSTREGF